LTKMIIVVPAKARTDPNLSFILVLSEYRLLQRFMSRPRLFDILDPVHPVLLKNVAR